MEPATMMMLAQALASFGGGLLGGSKDKIKKLSNFAPGQEKFFNQFLSQLQGMGGQGGGFNQATALLQDYLNPNSDIYSNFEQPYLNEFNQQTVPMLAERFAGLGGGLGAGGTASSGFGQALGAAGANLQTNLASMKSQMQRQSINDLLSQYMGMASLGLGAQPFSYLRQQGSPNNLGLGLQGFGGANLSGYFT